MAPPPAGCGGVQTPRRAQRLGQRERRGGERELAERLHCRRRLSGREPLRQRLSDGECGLLARRLAVAHHLLLTGGAHHDATPERVGLAEPEHRRPGRAQRGGAGAGEVVGDVELDARGPEVLQHARLLA